MMVLYALSLVNGKGHLNGENKQRYLLSGLHMVCADCSSGIGVFDAREPSVAALDRCRGFSNYDTRVGLDTVHFESTVDHAWANKHKSQAQGKSKSKISSIAAQCPPELDYHRQSHQPPTL
jgi:hypothetical protein